MVGNLQKDFLFRIFCFKSRGFVQPAFVDFFFWFFLIEKFCQSTWILFIYLFIGGNNRVIDIDFFFNLNFLKKIPSNFVMLHQWLAS